MQTIPVFPLSNLYKILPSYQPLKIFHCPFLFSSYPR
jgi:hypothetical protein